MTDHLADSLYDAPLQKLRAAARAAHPLTPEQRFAAEFRSQRVVELADEAFAATVADEDTPPPFRTLSAAQLDEYQPPDAYAAALKKMKEAKK